MPGWETLNAVPVVDTFWSSADRWGFLKALDSLASLFRSSSLCFASSLCCVKIPSNRLKVLRNGCGPIARDDAGPLPRSDSVIARHRSRKSWIFSTMSH